MLNNFIMFYELEIRVHGHFVPFDIVVILSLAIREKKNLVLGDLCVETIGQNESSMRWKYFQGLLKYAGNPKSCLFLNGKR